MYYLKSKENGKENGVTLIALIVTIIVLIILAGISITTLTGEDGLIDQATNNSEEAQKESIIGLIEAELLKEKTKTGNTPSIDDLKTIIQNGGYNDGTLVIQEPLSACIVRVDYYDTGLTYTLPKSEDGMGFKSKLIWGRSGDSDEPTIKVIDPFDLVN